MNSSNENVNNIPWFHMRCCDIICYTYADKLATETSLTISAFTNWSCFNSHGNHFSNMTNVTSWKFRYYLMKSASQFVHHQWLKNDLWHISYCYLYYWAPWSGQASILQNNIQFYLDPLFWPYTFVYINIIFYSKNKTLKNNYVYQNCLLKKTKTIF